MVKPKTFLYSTWVEAEVDEGLVCRKLAPAHETVEVSLGGGLIVRTFDQSLLYCSSLYCRSILEEKKQRVTLNRLRSNSPQSLPVFMELIHHQTCCTRPLYSF